MQFVLVINEAQTHTGVWRSEGTAPHTLNLCTRGKWEFNFTHRPLYFRRKPMSSDGVQKRSGSHGVEKSPSPSLPCRERDPDSSVVSPVAYSPYQKSSPGCKPVNIQHRSQARMREMETVHGIFCFMNFNCRYTFQTAAVLSWKEQWRFGAGLQIYQSARAKTVCSTLRMIKQRTCIVTIRRFRVTTVAVET